MTRVVHVVVAGEVGGAERMLAGLAASGAGAGIESIVVVLSPDDRIPALFRASRLHVVAKPSAEGPLAFAKQCFGPSESAWVADLLRSERADLAHVHTFASQVLGTRAARSAGIPVIRTEHSTRAFDDVTCWPFARWSLARAAASVAVSRHVRDVAVARAPWAAPRMRVIPNAVDVDHFSAAPPLRGGPLRLALIGRLEPRKGIDLALKTLARIDGVHLDVVGEGTLRSPLQRLARRLGVTHRVRFVGYVDDVRPFIAACHAVLCTSRSEGLGLALLEAMAMQRPVLGFRVGGVPEVVGPDLGHLLVTPGDVRALATSLERVAADPDRLEKRGALARAHVVRGFSLDAMVGQYALAYADVLGKNAFLGAR
jgi:glycosyltransferase involved in cell wall biosynthesis